MKKTAMQLLIDKLLWVMATQSNKEVIHGINIAIGHAENALETEREQIEEANIAGMEFIPVDTNRYKEDAEQYYKDTYQ
jgi:hypothetical protein